MPGVTARSALGHANGYAVERQPTARQRRAHWLFGALLAIATHAHAADAAVSTAAQTASAPRSMQCADSADADGIALPDRVTQGDLVCAHAPPGSRYEVLDHTQTVATDGRMVFGVPRDAEGTLAVQIQLPDGRRVARSVPVLTQLWVTQRIVGAPPETIEPPPAIAARIAREQAAVGAARHRDEPRDDWAVALQWPVAGRISGHFGQQRVYAMPDGRDVAGGGHSGMDIAAATGTPVHAPLAGVITFTGQLYLTGGTVLLDHGQGVSSNFLHLSRIDVVPGQRVARGEVIGAVGATGRATGPHLHWGMNWFEVRVDPERLLPPAPAPSRTSPRTTAPASTAP